MCVCLFGATEARAEPSEVDPTIGYNYGEIETARHAATAGAQRATSTSIGALFVNPANIAVGEVYHLGVLAQIWPEAKRQSYGAAASDSLVSKSELAGAAGATYNVQDSDGIDRQWTDLRFAMAYPFSNSLFLGAGGRFVWLEQTGPGPLGTSLASSGLSGEQIVKQWAFDAGVTVKPTPELSLSLVGQNLNSPNIGFMPTTVGGGIGYGVQEFGIEVDAVADFTTWEDTAVRAMLGLESLLAGQYALRGGYRYDQGTGDHALAMGFGYVAREFQAELGARRTLGDQAVTALVVSFTYHLETTGFEPAPGEGL
jgi:opacity protein-like surface antigen